MGKVMSARAAAFIRRRDYLPLELISDASSEVYNQAAAGWTKH